MRKWRTLPKDTDWDEIEIESQLTENVRNEIFHHSDQYYQ